MDNRKIKGVIAYGLVPYGGGTTTVYRLLARGLRELGWKVFSVAVGKQAAQGYAPDFGDEFSVILAPEETSLAGQAQAFLDWVAKEKVDVVIPNCEANIIATIPHLPPKVRYISVCHNVTRATYLLSTLHADRLSFIVAMNIKQMEELEDHWSVPRAKLRFIPNAIDHRRFFKDHSLSADSPELHLIYLGRIDEMAKGVMLLPPILREISQRGVPYSLDIVGGGPDLVRLQNSVNKYGLSARVRFRGSLPPAEIPQVLSRPDIFLMPSRFEGCSLSLMEAMAAGCLPIATDLQGITDTVVEDGVSGFLCPMGQVKAFADKIVALHHDRERLRHMAVAAQRRVAENFSLERMAADYDRLFTEALSQSPIDYTIRPLEEIEFSRELLPTWRTWVPQPVKNLARKVLFRYFDYMP